VLHAAGELGSREHVFHGGEALGQCFQIRYHDLDVPAHEVGLARGQVELRLPHVDPHVLDSHHDVWIASEAEALDVEGGGEPLVGHAHVDVFQHEDVADVLLPPIVTLHVDPPRERGAAYPSPGCAETPLRAFYAIVRGHGCVDADLHRQRACAA